jgi:predicted kinase
MTTLRTTVGAPGAGKTREANSWVAIDPTVRARINRDELRIMLHGGYLGTRCQEEQVNDVRDSGIIKLLRHGISVVVDDTNLRWGHVAHLQQIARRIRVEFEVVSYLHVDVEICIERDAQRDNPLGRNIIMGMWCNALRNQVETWRSRIMDDLLEQGYRNVEKMIKAAIADPFDTNSSTVVAKARYYTDRKLLELAPKMSDTTLASAE